MPTPDVVDWDRSFAFRASRTRSDARADLSEADGARALGGCATGKLSLRRGIK
jgi:hypothetical protein